MSESNEIRDRILIHSMTLFERFGFKRVTMDEIAAGLGISKKTIYQHFSDKNLLVDEVASLKMELERVKYQQIRAESSDAIQELHLISEYIRKTLYNFHPGLLHDMQKYHPEVWEKFREYKREFILKNIKHNLEWGVADGVYRNNFDSGILGVLRLGQIEMCFDEERYPTDEFDFKEVQEQLWDHFLEGILTDKGRKLLNNYRQTIKSEI